MLTTQQSLTEALAEISAMTRAFQDHANGGPLPILATPEQILAERLTLEVLHHPAVRSAQADTLSELRGHPNSQSTDGARTLERTILLWTTTLIMQKIGEHISPAFLVYADDTPHTWFGHEFPGVGLSGDNPDNIYRVAEIDGARHYEVKGQMPANPSAQVTIDLTRAIRGGGTANSKTTDLGTNIKLLMDEDLEIDSKGRFTIAVSPNDHAGNHMRSEPGSLEIWVRESKSDWRQSAIQLSIHSLDDQERPAPTQVEIALKVAADLKPWCTRWATFRMSYLGRPPVNTINPPVGRDGSWGVLAGGRWELNEDEAIIAVIDPQGARYIGVQLTDPWALTLDTRTTISARNNSQTQLNADGSATYVISARDPQIANWISTSGLTQGEIRFRWQRLPTSFDPANTIRDYRKVAFADLARELPSLIRRVTPDARRAERQQRARDFDTRWID